MAKKFINIGMIAKAKPKTNDPNEQRDTFIKIDNDITLKAGQYVNLQKKPTESDVEDKPHLKKILEKWYEHKIANLYIVVEE